MASYSREPETTKQARFWPFLLMLGDCNLPKYVWLLRSADAIFDNDDYFQLLSLITTYVVEAVFFVL